MPTALARTSIYEQKNSVYPKTVNLRRENKSGKN